MGNLVTITFLGLWHRLLGGQRLRMAVASALGGQRLRMADYVRGPQATREAPQRLVLPALNYVTGLTGAVKG